jgi:hypothetical protein
LSQFSLPVSGKKHLNQDVFIRHVNPHYHGEIFETAKVDGNGLRVIPPGETFTPSNSRDLFLNVFGIPEEYQTTEFHPENPLAESSGIGYLYTWYEYNTIDLSEESLGTDNNHEIKNDATDASYDYYYYYYYYNYYYYNDDGTCVNTIQPNRASGIKMNTCLIAATSNGSSSYDYSLVYTCDGKYGYKTVYSGNNCNPLYQLYNDSFVLKKCHYTFGITFYSGCSPYSNIIPLPPSTSTSTSTTKDAAGNGATASSAWMTTQ